MNDPRLNTYYVYATAFVIYDYEYNIVDKNKILYH